MQLGEREDKHILKAKWQPLSTKTLYSREEEICSKCVSDNVVKILPLSGILNGVKL